MCAPVRSLACKDSDYFRIDNVTNTFFIKKKHLSLSPGLRCLKQYGITELPVHAVVSAQVEQSEQVDKTVIVNVKVAVLIRLMLE